MEENTTEQMEADVQRMLDSGGDPLYCAFDEAVSVAFAKAIFGAGPGVRTLERDGLNEKGERTRWRGVKPVTGEVEWFNFGGFCPPRPPEDCLG